VQVADYGGGEIAIFSGGATGAVCRLSLAVPLAPGAGPQDIQACRHPPWPVRVCCAGGADIGLNTLERMVLNLLKRYDAKFADVACRQTGPQSQTLFSVTLTADSLICSWAIHISSFAAQLRAGGFEGADLLPWAQLHAGPVTGLSVQHDTGELATCGLDGRVFLLPATVNCSFTFRPGGNPARLDVLLTRPCPDRPSNRRRSFCLAHSAHLPRDSSLD